MVQVERRDRATLLPLIERWIVPGTLIIADGWKAYDCLTQHDYDLLRVNHRKTFKTSADEIPDCYPDHIREVCLIFFPFLMYSSEQKKLPK